LKEFGSPSVRVPSGIPVLKMSAVAEHARRVAGWQPTHARLSRPADQAGTEVNSGSIHPCFPMWQRLDRGLPNRQATCKLREGPGALPLADVPLHPRQLRVVSPWPVDRIPRRRGRPRSQSPLRGRALLARGAGIHGRRVRDRRGGGARDPRETRHRRERGGWRRSHSPGCSRSSV
jgi:hypothetical protein